MVRHYTLLGKVRNNLLVIARTEHFGRNLEDGILWRPRDGIDWGVFYLGRELAPKHWGCVGLVYGCLFQLGQERIDTRITVHACAASIRANRIVQ